MLLTRMSLSFLSNPRYVFRESRVYLKSYETLPEARLALKEYFEFYNTERPHQSLDYRTPLEVHFPDNGVEGDPQNTGAIFLNFAASWS